MTPEERELRRALDSRSGEVTPEFRARLSSALAEGRPASNFLPAMAAVAAVVLVFATVGVLLLARQSQNQPPPIPATTPSANPIVTPSAEASPTPTMERGVLNKPPSPIALPASAQLSAPSSDVVWAFVVNEYLYRSIDRGVNWEQRPMPARRFGGVQWLEISFVSSQEGWLTMSGAGPSAGSFYAAWILHTTDAGITWQLWATKGIGDSKGRNGLSFVDSHRGFLDAWDPNHAAVIYRTTDGGQTWKASEPLPEPPSLKTVCIGCTATQAGPVRAFGSTLLVSAWQQSGSATQYVYRSTDGGATWNYLATAPAQDGNVDFVTGSHWLKLIGPGQSKETTDAGATWHSYASDYSQAAPIAADFAFADSNVGYGTVRGAISRTVDGGLHWTRIHTPGT
jgi:photosystem II stability/assembly factor-like uncharacterized protein